MTNRLRSAEITVFCAWIALVVAGMGYGKMVEYDDFSDLTRSHPLIAIAFNTLVAGAWLSLLAVVVGGLPLAFAAARYALASRRWVILGLLGAPLVAFAALLGYIFLATLVLARGESGPTPRNVALFIGLLAVFALAAAVSAAGVSRAIATSEISPRVIEFARIPTLATALCMVAVTAGLLVWGLSLATQVPDLFNGNDGVLATNTALNWLVGLVVMGLATIIAIVASFRGLLPHAPKPQLA